MHPRRTVPKPFLAICVLLSVTACGGGKGTAVGGYSGTYYVAVGHTPSFVMTIQESGGVVAFQLQGEDLYAGTGTASAGVMTLQAPISGLGTLAAQLIFAPDRNDFAGTWEIPEAPMSGTITGTRDVPATYDVDALGLPSVVTADCIDLDKIAQVSRFRSGVGHDYSDDFESCRSMKHYYLPKGGVDFSTIRIYSPVSGTVLGTTEEWDGPSLWKGTAVGIVPDGRTAFFVVLFHVDLATPLAVGDHVAAGQLLGTSEKTTGTATDMAVGVETPTGMRLVSFFQVMTSAVFQVYANRGVASPDELVITAGERDADPLTCNDQQFQDPGSIENWVYLN